MLELVNQARLAAGLRPLTEDPTLDEVASERSLDMALRQYFSHRTPEGRTVFDAMDQRSFGLARPAAENLALISGGEQQAVNTAFGAFRTSPAHWRIILDPTYRQLGVGVARHDDQTLFTLVFLG